MQVEDDVRSNYSIDDEDEEDQENEPPVVVAAQSAQAASVAASARRPVGRPAASRAPLEQLTFNDAPTNLGSFLSSLIQTANEYNLTDRSRMAIHKVLQKHVTPNFPSYNQAVSLISTQFQNPKSYPACPHDCTVHPVPYGKVTPDDLKELRCSVCDSSYTDHKGRVLKVRSMR